MEIKFWDGLYPQGTAGRGYAVLKPDGEQVTYVHHCKEVFASYFVMDDKKADGVIRFLRMEPYKKSSLTVAHQEQILHAFEKALGITPEAKIEQVANTRNVKVSVVSGRWEMKEITENFLLYTVSEMWAKNRPLAHVLGLITRHYYPRGRRISWKIILSWLTRKGYIDEMTKNAIKEIIDAAGEVDAEIPNNGVTDYAINLALKRAGLPFERAL